MKHYNKTAIQVHNLSKVYKLYDKHIDRLKEAINPFKRKYHRPFYALKNIDFSIKKGEILGIVGQNGAGKSTLVKIVTGILTPTDGHCDVKGRVAPLLSLTAGFNPELTGIENVYMTGMLRGYSKEEIDDRMEDILSFAGIGDFVHQPVRTYSSGMVARLGFSAAVHIEPEILILDEVLSVGDELFRRKCFAKMETLFASGCTILFISHSISAVNDLCTRAILIDKGELILEGPPKFVTMHYQKYINTSPEEQAIIRDDIIRLNGDNDKKKNFVADTDVDEKDLAATNTAQKQKIGKDPGHTAYYIPNFEPKSTVVTKNYDVDIFDLHVRTLAGEKVNALILNEEYIYSFKARFNIDAVEVGVGSAFKTVKGMVVTNYTLFGDYIEEVKKGAILIVDCHFNCKFLAGNYYTNASVGALIDGKRVVLNHIVDALVFKVQSPVKKKKFGGLVYCDQVYDIRIE
jgi:lipopolysaccharide transport system ATP-binding protein